MLAFAVYVSSAREHYTTDQLHEMLAMFRAKNEKLGITGMLLYRDGDFMQYIEGPPGEVEALLRVIEKDPRHTRMISLLRGNIEERLFDNWSMGFRCIESNAEGHSHIFNIPFSSSFFTTNPHAAQRLLLSFRHNADLQVPV